MIWITFIFFLTRTGKIQGMTDLWQEFLPEMEVSPTTPN